MRCSQIRQHLNDSVPLDGADIQEHIGHCAPCRRAWEAERLLRKGFAAARVEQGEPVSMGTAQAWVESVITQEKEHVMKSLIKHPFASPRRRWGWLATATVAAAFLVLVPFSYYCTCGTCLKISSPDASLATTDVAAIEARLTARGLEDVTVRSSGEASGSSVTYFVRGPKIAAQAAFAATRDLLPALAAPPSVSFTPWRERESGSLLAQIGSGIFEIHIDAAGKTEAQLEEEIRSQMTANGMTVGNVSVKREGDSTTVNLEGVVPTSSGCTGTVKLRTVEAGSGSLQVNERIVLPTLDPNLSDAEKIAEIKRQLAANGINNAVVTIENGKVKVEVKEEKPEN